MPDDIWSVYEMTVGGHRRWPVGDAVFHVRRDENEWRVGRQPAPNSEVEPSWKRWPAGDDWTEARLAPIMPDRPVVARPESPLQLAPGCEAVFYVSIPVWVRLSVGRDDGDVVLLEAPTVVLSNIWFGEPTEGELCYSLKTRMRRTDTTDSSENPHRALCKVRMINGMTDPVDFQRLCLQVKHLSVYRSPSHLWTDSVNVTYERKRDQVVRVAFVGKPDEIAGDASCLSKARTPPPSGHFLQKGMGVVKSWM